jgi:hypothetical protein
LCVFTCMEVSKEFESHSPPSASVAEGSALAGPSDDARNLLLIWSGSKFDNMASYIIWRGSERRGRTLLLGGSCCGSIAWTCSTVLWNTSGGRSTTKITRQDRGLCLGIFAVLEWPKDDAALPDADQVAMNDPVLSPLPLVPSSHACLCYFWKRSPSGSHLRRNKSQRCGL